MPDPINLITSILLRMRPQVPPSNGGGNPVSPASSGKADHTPAPSPLPLPMEGSEQHYRLQQSDAGWKTPAFPLPNKGILKIRFSLPGEKLTLSHSVSAQSGTEPIPLPAVAASQGNLWLVRLPEQQFLLVWMPLGIPPIPLNQLQLSMSSNTVVSSNHARSRHTALFRYTLRAIIVLFIVCALLTLI